LIVIYPSVFNVTFHRISLCCRCWRIDYWLGACRYCHPM